MTPTFAEAVLGLSLLGGASAFAVLVLASAVCAGWVAFGCPVPK